MAQLEILNASGHAVLKWDEVALAAGDEEAHIAVRKAERVLQDHLARGATAFVTVENELAQRTDRLDPNVDTTIVPPLVGG